MNDMMQLEKTMLRRVRLSAVREQLGQFPPEADGNFAPVSDEEVRSWQEKLNARYSVGTGKLKIVDDPFLPE
jgi:hypothetical protein